MRGSAVILCVGALASALTLCLPVATASAKYGGQCGGLLSFSNFDNQNVRYAVVTLRPGDCRRGRRAMKSYLNRMGRYARSNRCSGTGCVNAAPRGWGCGLASYADRKYPGVIARCERRRITVSAMVWPPMAND